MKKYIQKIFKKIDNYSQKIMVKIKNNKYKTHIIIAILGIILLGILLLAGFIPTIVVIISGGFLLGLKYGGNIMRKKRKKISNTKIKKKPNRNKQPKKKKNIWKKILYILGLILLIGAILLLILIILFGMYIVKVAPHFDPENLYRKEASIIYDNSGNIITKIGREMRDKISYNDLPEVLIDAIIATEDARYFQHNGFDAPRFFRAGIGEITGQNAGGASTLSMQVIKNSFTSTERSYVRKFTDIYLSIFKLEKKYTKEEIIEFYVNTPYLGNSSYGVAEAARNYFGKEVQDINLTEAALIAGLFQAPGAYDPYLYPERIERRRTTVLYLMRRHGYISREEEEIANSIPIEDLLIERNNQESMVFQGYVDVVIEEVERKTGYNPYNVPMRIYTNYASEKQNYLNRILSGEIFKFPNDVVQAGIAVTDIHTGAILAIGNGRNRRGERLFNFATMLKKQIGSTAKPIFEYGPGIEYNNWSTYTPFIDDVHSYSNNRPMTNWDGKYDGFLTLRYALGKSRNIPALKAFQQLNNGDILKFVTSLGIEPEIEGGRVHEAHAIGAFNGASPLQLAAAYAAFGNGGYYIEPHSVSKVEYIDTNDVETFTADKTRVMSEATAFMITDILRYSIDNRLISGGRVSGVEVAAKSGTTNFDAEIKKRFNLSSNALNDLWYAGYSPDYAIGMWLGYEKIDSKYHHTTASWSLRNNLFTLLAQGIFERNNKKFTPPNSVVRVTVEKGTMPAMLASEWTPQSFRSAEYFIRGTQPTEVSPRFRTLTNPANVDINIEGSKIKLSWNSVTPPSIITNELLDLYGVHKDKYVSILHAENLEVLGTIGYDIYLKKDNQLYHLGWTGENQFTHTPATTGSLTYVIKTSYSIFKDNRSSGHEITISDNPFIPIIEVSLNGSSTINLQVNDPYNELGVLVMENLVNVTSNATITKTTTRMSDEEIIPNNQINTSSPETYVINYKVVYKGETYNLTRTVIIE